LKIDDDEVLVSYDVVGLYPNVPIEETVRSIKTWFSTEIQDPEKFEIYNEAVETFMNQKLWNQYGKFVVDYRTKFLYGGF
jgi:hypothetical protein